MRNWTSALVIVGLVGCGGGAAASSNSESTPAAAGSSNREAEAESLPLDEFVESVIAQGTGELCGAPDAPFRGCFQVTADQCAAGVAAGLRGCTENMRASLPATVDASNVDATGTAIGQCLGMAYRMGMEQNNLVLQTPECQQPSS